MRTATIERETKETKVALSIDLDGAGTAHVDTGVPFLDHMLDLFAYHGCFDLDVACQGDVEVDGHHSTEDVGIALGRAISEALGDRRGIFRYGDFCDCRLDVPAERLGTFETELADEFMAAFARELGASLHVRKLAGRNSHHFIEAAFKGLGRAMRAAVSIDDARDQAVPSTKGTIL